MTFVFAEESEAELREAAAYYAERASVALSDASLGEVLAQTELVSVYPCDELHRAFTHYSGMSCRLDIMQVSATTMAPTKSFGYFPLC